MKDGDFFLVNVAEGEVKIMTEPEVKSDATITAFKQGSWVNSDGQIDYADTAKYDPEVLDAYNQKNMKDLTYDIFLDKYGYLIGLELNEDTVEVLVDGSAVKTTPIEFKILSLLMRNAGRVFSADEIYERVWNERAVNTDTVMVHVRNIREKIELDPKRPKYLKVVWGVGYKIEK